MSKPRLATLKPRLQVSQPATRTLTPGSWRGDKSSSERGYGWRWQQAREAFLKDNPLCVMHKAEGFAVPATVVDHIKAHRGDQELFWNKANWQSLCKSCHDTHAQRRDQVDLSGF